MARSATPPADEALPRSLVNGAIVVGALYFARDILLPFGLAVLLSFLLAPIVDRLERWGRRRITAVLSTVTVVFLFVAILGFVLAHQAYELAYQLPHYKENIIEKLEPFTLGDEDSVWSRVTSAVEEVKERVTPPEKEKSRDEATDVTASEPAAATPEQILVDREHPVPVEIIEVLTAGEIAQGIIGPAIAPLATAGIVIIFVIFMLLYREDLRNRMIQLIGVEQIHSTTQAINDAAARVSRYLLMQMVINSAYGLVIAVGLALIGLPNAVLWGVMTAMLRFIPYAGPWIAAAMPIAVSLAVFDGWMRPGLVIVLFILNELVSNNVIEPWLYGSSTGISPIGILTSAIFWAWIWGPVGLVMATPLTVCLTVMGRYVPQLAFLNTLLSEDNVLPPHSRYYQRLLALDPEEAFEVAEEFLATTSEPELYETVLIPALTLAEQDRRRGALDDQEYQMVLQVTRELIEEHPVPSPGPPVDHEFGEEQAVKPVEGVNLLCLPARSQSDEIVGSMLAQVVGARGVALEVGSRESLIGEMIERIAKEEINIVCISSTPPLAVTHARYLCKRLRARYPELKIVAGIWQAGGITRKSQDRLAEIGVNTVSLTLENGAEALEQLARSTQLVKQADDTPDQPDSPTANDSELE